MRNKPTPIYYRLDLGGGDLEFPFTEVPIHFSPEKEQFPAACVDVQLGAEKLSLPLDTGHGLGSILLSPAVLDKLDIEYTGRTHENYDAFGQRYDSREYLLPDIHIGDLTFANVSGFELFTRWDTPGVVGLPFLRHFNVLIDYPGRRFGLYPRHMHPEYLDSPGWARLKLDPERAGLVLPVTFKDYDETFHFCLDTGATSIEQGKHYNLINSKSPLGKLLQQEEVLEPSTEIEVLGKLSTSQFWTASGNTLIRMDFALVDMEVLKIDGLLGHNFFLNYAVFYDSGAQEVYLKLMVNKLSLEEAPVTLV